LCFGLRGGRRLRFLRRLGDSRFLILRLFYGDGGDEALGLGLGFGFLRSARLRRRLRLGLSLRNCRRTFARLFFGLFARLCDNGP